MILGIGNDLVDCRRIDKTIERFGARFINRVFTKQEQGRVSQKFNQSAGYAKVFAMKEATLKALGTGLTNGIMWHDVELFREFENAPYVVLSGAAQEVIRKLTPDGYKAYIHVSVSDEWPYAQAFAMISSWPTN